MKPSLAQLSSGWPDLNRRPSRPRSGYATGLFGILRFSDCLKVPFTSEVFDLCFFPDRFSSVRTGFNMDHFPGYASFCGLISSGIMTLKARFKVLGLAYVKTIQGSGVQYVYKIFHKKRAKLDETQPGSTLVGVAGFEPTTLPTPVGIRYRTFWDLKVFRLSEGTVYFRSF